MPVVVLPLPLKLAAELLLKKEIHSHQRKML
jgi:hypothetical protein